MNEDLKLLLDKADTLKGELSALRPLPEDALEKIQDALDIEYTYESNRIEGNTLTLQETALVVMKELPYPANLCVNIWRLSIIARLLIISKI